MYSCWFVTTKEVRSVELILARNMAQALRDSETGYFAGDAGSWAEY
jgi:hypothetical protein